MIKVLTVFFLTTGLLLIAACSTNRPLLEPDVTAPVKKAPDSAAEKGWWTYRYRIKWPEEEAKPDLAIDLLLAHALVRPVLEKNAEKILFWRFHRRAAQDDAGHQFSFIFFTDGASAIEIIESLDNSLLLAALKENGLILKTVSSNTGKENNTAVDAYSDKSWPAAIRKTWPSYIMGVSKFWLALIDEVKSEQIITQSAPSESSDAVKDLIQVYREIDNEIAELWKSEGQHALLHHLSGVFGYKPLLIKKEVIY